VAFVLAPGGFGGIETPLASNGSAVFAAVVNLPVPMTVKGIAENGKAFAASVLTATGEMVAVSQATGKIIWDDKLPSSPYGAATVTNDVVFATTCSGYLYAFNTATGAVPAEDAAIGRDQCPGHDRRWLRHRRSRRAVAVNEAAHTDHRLQARRHGRQARDC
jgi:hypothetical protein